MSSAAPVLAALVAGPASILFAAVSLAQFKYVYLLLSDLATRRSKIYLLSLLRPGTAHCVFGCTASSVHISQGLRV